MSSIVWHDPILSKTASLTLILVLSCFSIIYVIGLMILIIARKEMQPLKIKSPRLMLLSIFANLFIIISVSTIQLSEEECVNSGEGDDSFVCELHVLEIFSLSFGYILIGFTEPLAIISYVLRAFRLRSIYDAQLTYFREERKPVELIEKFKEARLIMITAVSVAALTVLYLITALCLMFIPEHSNLYKLPSIDTASFAEGS